MLVLLKCESDDHPNFEYTCENGHVWVGLNRTGNVYIMRRDKCISCDKLRRNERLIEELDRQGWEVVAC